MLPVQCNTSWQESYSALSPLLKKVYCKTTKGKIYQIRIERIPSQEKSVVDLLMSDMYFLFFKYITELEAVSPERYAQCI